MTDNTTNNNDARTTASNNTSQDGTPDGYVSKEMYDALLSEKEGLLNKNKGLNHDMHKHKDRSKMYEDAGVDLDTWNAFKAVGLSKEKLSDYETIMQAAKDDEQRNILAKGGIDAVFNHRAEALKQDFNREKEQFGIQIKDLSDEVQTVTGLYREERYSNAVRDAIASDGRYKENAIGDIIQLVRPYVRWTDSNEMEILDAKGDVKYHDTKEDGLQKMDIVFNTANGAGAEGSYNGTPPVDNGENPFMTGDKAGQILLRKNAPEKASAAAKHAKSAGKYQGKTNW